MDDIEMVQRLVDMLSAFFTEGKAVEEDLKYSLTSEFIRNIQDILFTKQIVSYSRYQDYFNEKSKEMLSSPEMYLKYIFYACIQNGLVNLKTYENFLSSFAIILRICLETRFRKGKDFCKLVPGIFMVLYINELNSSFKSGKGFYGLMEYVNNPKYLQSKCIKRNISSFYHPKIFVDGIPKDLSEKMQKMMKQEKNLKSCNKFPDLHHDSCCSDMVKDILKFAKPEIIPTMKDNGDLKPSPSNLIQQKIAQVKEEGKIILKISEGDSELTFERCLRMCSDSKTNEDAVVKLTDNERYQDIIEAVIRHNHSKNSCHVKSKSRTQVEADGILEHMKKTIKSLTEVLDESNKE